MEKKYTISRSFVRRLNLGNYEHLDCFSSHSQELDVEEVEEIEGISKDLFERAKEDVMVQIRDYASKKGQLSVNVDKIVEIINSMNRNGNIGDVEVYESLTEDENKIVQEIKKLSKRKRVGASE